MQKRTIALIICILFTFIMACLVDSKSIVPTILTGVGVICCWIVVMLPENEDDYE